MKLFERRGVQGGGKLFLEKVFLPLLYLKYLEGAIPAYFLKHLEK